MKLTKQSEEVENVLTRIYFRLLIDKGYEYGLWLEDILPPSDGDIQKKEEYIKKLEEYEKKRRNWEKLDSISKKTKTPKGRKPTQPHNKTPQRYQQLLRQFCKENFIIDLGKGDDGKHWYEANPEVIEAFIRRYAFNRYEVQWAEKVLERLIKKDSWTEAVDCVLKSTHIPPLLPIGGTPPKYQLIESRPLEFIPFLICFIFGGIRTMKKIDEYIPYFTHGRLDGEIDFVGVFLFQEEYFQVLGERFNWGQNLNVSSEIFRKKMREDILWDFRLRVLKRMKKNALEEKFFDPPLTDYMSKDQKDKYLSLSKKKLLEETISFVKSVPDHFVREYLGENTWEKTLREVYEDEEKIEREFREDCISFLKRGHQVMSHK